MNKLKKYKYSFGLSKYGTYTITVGYNVGHGLRVVGYIEATSEGRGYLYLRQILIDVKARRLGLGKALYKYAEKVWRKREVKHITLTTDSKSRPFWKKMGFVERTRDEQSRYYPDKIYMDKRLK